MPRFAPGAADIFFGIHTCQTSPSSRLLLTGVACLMTAVVQQHMSNTPRLNAESAAQHMRLGPADLFEAGAKLMDALPMLLLMSMLLLMVGREGRPDVLGALDCAWGASETHFHHHSS